MTLEHHQAEKEEYTHLFSLCEKTNLLQDYAYGEAKESVDGLKALRYVLKIENKPVAIYQALLKSYGPLGTVVRVNRGPIFLKSILEDETKTTQIVQCIHEKWVKEKEYFLLFAPNLENTIPFEKKIASLDLHACGDKWESGYIDLRISEEILRKNFKQKWRNMLNKSEKMGMEIHEIKTKNDFFEVLNEYDLFMKEKKFQGVSSDLIRGMYAASPDSIYSLVAKNAAGNAGAVIMVKHGDTCTYLVGLTNENGRKMNANYLLIWNVLIHCKQAGMDWFDVGGIDNINNPGVAHFKKGLGFSPYQLLGEFEGRLGCRNMLLSAAKKIRGN